MTPTEVYTIPGRRPDDAFRRRMASGDEIIIERPRGVIIEELMMYVGQSDDPDSPFARTLRYASIPNIAGVERIDRAQLRPRNRRQRGR